MDAYSIACIAPVLLGVFGEPLMHIFLVPSRVKRLCASKARAYVAHLHLDSDFFAFFFSAGDGPGRQHGTDQHDQAAAPPAPSDGMMAIRRHVQSKFDPGATVFSPALVLGRGDLGWLRPDRLE